MTNIELDELIIEFCRAVGLEDQAAHLLDSDDNPGERLRTALLARDKQLVNEARIETADWMVHIVDAVEGREGERGDYVWRLFKHIRNTMRDEFKAKYGVDPSPGYQPVQLKPNQEHSNDKK